MEKKTKIRKKHNFNTKNTLVGVFRISKKLTRDRLAVLLGVSSGTIGRWERGEFKPSKLAQEKIDKMVKAINGGEIT